MHTVFIMLSKVDYVLITSLFVCEKKSEWGAWPGLFAGKNGQTERRPGDRHHGCVLRLSDGGIDSPFKVMVCNGAVWQRTVPFLLRKSEWRRQAAGYFGRQLFAGAKEEPGKERELWRRFR